MRENSQGEDNGAGSWLITMVKEALYIEMTLVEELVHIKALRHSLKLNSLRVTWVSKDYKLSGY